MTSFFGAFDGDLEGEPCFVVPVDVELRRARDEAETGDGRQEVLAQRGWALDGEKPDGPLHRGGGEPADEAPTAMLVVPGLKALGDVEETSDLGGGDPLGQRRRAGGSEQTGQVHRSGDGQSADGQQCSSVHGVRTPRRGRSSSDQHAPLGHSSGAIGRVRAGLIRMGSGFIRIAEDHGPRPNEEASRIEGIVEARGEVLGTAVDALLNLEQHIDADLQLGRDGPRSGVAGVLAAQPDLVAVPRFR
ncbi:hypothetical protein ACFWAR_00570 [Streptomyces sp. NPDC059917]|uniref:hypothetical protein n=1 Tax=Streptomyces sp. NPDC059917 TaxID=3347002 RepID=UPI00365A6206